MSLELLMQRTQEELGKFLLKAKRQLREEKESLFQKRKV
mgnify:CR=1 FL=1